MSKRVVALTTFDNPFDPFEDFASWYLYDAINKGYNTCGYIARISNVEESMSQKEKDDEIERAIDEIISNDFLSIYKKVTKEVDDEI